MRAFTLGMGAHNNLGVSPGIDEEQDCVVFGDKMVPLGTDNNRPECRGGKVIRASVVRRNGKPPMLVRSRGETGALVRIRLSGLEDDGKRSRFNFKGSPIEHFARRFRGDAGEGMVDDRLIELTSPDDAVEIRRGKATYAVVLGQDLRHIRLEPSRSLFG
ncbi:MAG: hypothetical protein A3B14_00175 [Candidatus Zambryskibacteria bacterium RIFCSPLOWO2_01_FULL_45_21]|uniref:Uncharacterized protein n=1 Tax=Candidatus Zambryskibacteria bacterium RIFCSPLOWO2_01_FULL_45_21 TaxID=1802761 RepID=A0A1G2U0L8_9BACT|nr:MAG: hypothetical protein A3B14_00175 [Candidatus Zambryskibacteria bacterium RIFCSPLOWO2_01_FULL_45_21]